MNLKESVTDPVIRVKCKLGKARTCFCVSPALSTVLGTLQMSDKCVLTESLKGAVVLGYK